MILGFVVVALLPDRPATAPWLNSREKACLETLVARTEPAPVRLKDGLLTTQVWLFAAIYFGLVLGLYGFGLWAPQIPRPLGGLGLNCTEYALVGEELGKSPLGHYVVNGQAPDAGNMEILREFGTDAKRYYEADLIAGQWNLIRKVDDQPW